MLMQKAFAFLLKSETNFPSANNDDIAGILE